MSTRPFRVVTWNLLHDPLDLTWPERAPLVEARLLSLQPDIVLLQEVAWPDEQATSLASALNENMGVSYTTHLTGLFATTGWQEGLAILSRFPHVGSSELVFPKAETFCHRVRFDIEGSTVDIYNSHLDPYSAERRARQILMAKEWMDGFDDASATVFGGDLNGTPDSAEIAPLYTTLRSTYATVHGEDPPRVIDYLWISPALTITAADFEPDQLSRGDSSLLPSDHLALCVDLEWR